MAKSYPKNILIIKSCIDTSLGTLLGGKYDSAEFMLGLITRAEHCGRDSSAQILEQSPGNTIP